MSSEHHTYMSSCLWRDRHPVMGCSQKLQGCVWNGPKSSWQHKELGKAEHKKRVLQQQAARYRNTPVPLAELRSSMGCPSNNPQKWLWSTFFCTFTCMGQYFWNTWWENSILEMTTLQQIMILLSIRMSNYTPESCFGKESLNIVLHKGYAGTTMFHKNINTKIFKTSLYLLHQNHACFFFFWQY